MERQVIMMRQTVVIVYVTIFGQEQLIARNLERATAILIAQEMALRLMLMHQMAAIARATQYLAPVMIAQLLDCAMLLLTAVVTELLSILSPLLTKAVNACVKTCGRELLIARRPDIARLSRTAAVVV